MKRFRFRMEQLLRLKRQRERLAEIAQNRAAVNAAKAWAAVSEAQAALTRAADEHATRVRGGALASVWLAGYAHANALSQDLHRARADAAIAERALADATKERRRRTVEAEALVYLRDRAWEAYAAEGQKADQIRLDDLSIRMWTIAQNRGDDS